MAITFDVKITRPVIEDLIEDLNNMPMPRELFINSVGGRFVFFQELGPDIEQFMVTTVAGNVRSAAVILFLLGNRRIVTPESSLFFHEPYLDAGHIERMPDRLSMAELRHRSRTDPIPSERLLYAAWLDELCRARLWFIDFVCHRSFLTMNEVTRMMREEKTMDASEAMYFGLATEYVKRWAPALTTVPARTG